MIFKYFLYFAFDAKIKIRGGTGMELGKKIILIILLFGLSQFPMDANAYIVWNQKIDDAFFTHTSNNFYTDYYGTETIAADDFISSSDAEISIVNWQGAVLDGDNDLLNGFWIRFYSNNGTVPYSLLCEEYVPMEDILFVDRDHYASYTANLTTASFLALANTPYWFSVQADTLIKYAGDDDNSGWWGWAGNYSTILNPAYDIVRGPLYNETSFYFELSNPVPIPGAVWLLGSGLLGLVGLRRRINS